MTRKDPTDKLLDLLTTKGYADTKCPRCQKAYREGETSCSEKTCVKVKYCRKDWLLKKKLVKA